MGGAWLPVLSPKRPLMGSIPMPSTMPLYFILKCLYLYVCKVKWVLSRRLRC